MGNASTQYTSMVNVVKLTNGKLPPTRDSLEMRVIEPSQVNNLVTNVTDRVLSTILRADKVIKTNPKAQGQATNHGQETKSSKGLPPSKILKKSNNKSSYSKINNYGMNVITINKPTGVRGESFAYQHLLGRRP